MASDSRHRPQKAQPVSVTVVLVARNDAARICDAVQSLLALDGSGHRIEIIDDGSVDDTWALIRKAIAANPDTPHQVVTSRFVEPLGERRLLRALAAVKTDVAIIASPRDHARANRVDRLLHVFALTAASVVVTDRVRLGGSIIEHVSASRFQGSGYMEPREIALQIGSSSTNLGTMALRPEVLRNWPSMSDARMADDLGLILAFRGSLLGGCYYLDEQLVGHENPREFDPSDTRSRDVCRETMFASLLASRVGLLHDMRQGPFDESRICEGQNGVSGSSRVRLEASLKGVLIELAERWTESREPLIARGMIPGWEFDGDDSARESGGPQMGSQGFMKRVRTLFTGTNRSAA